MLRSTLVHISVSKMPRKDTTKVKKKSASIKRARKGIPTLEERKAELEKKRLEKRKEELKKKKFLTEEEKRRKRLEIRKAQLKKEQLRYRSSKPLDVSPKPIIRR